MRDFQSVLSDPELVDAREHHVERLRRLFDGHDEADTAFVLCGTSHWLNGAASEDINAEIMLGLKNLAAAAENLRDPHVFRPIALECDMYGVHFTDKILGGDVFNLDGSWQVRPLSAPVGELQSSDLGSNPTWQRAQEFARAFAASSGSVPYFGLPTIASALNVGVNLYGEQLLVSMLEDPEAAEHDLRVINRLLCTMHQWYSASLPHDQLQPVIATQRTQPPGFGQLCGCTTQLISPGQYAEFIAPLDAELLGTYPLGGMIHLCGSHTQHIPAWRGMKQLRAIQINDRAADDIEYYWNGLRDDQILYINPTISTPVERVMDITGGYRVVIVADITDLSVIKRRSQASR